MSPEAEFAGWLEATHPDIFEAVYATAISQGMSHRLAGYGDVEMSNVMADFGSNLDQIQFEATSGVNADYIALDLGGSDTGVSTPTVEASPTGTSSAGGVLSSLESIGHWLTSSQGLTAIANVGTAVLKTQGAIATQQAATQMAVIQAQAQRAQAGQSPAPISYMTDANGHSVPVYSTAHGIPTDLETAIQQGRAHPITLADGSTGYTVDAPVLGSLLSTTSPWLWAGIALLVGLALYQTSR